MKKAGAFLLIPLAAIACAGCGSQDDNARWSAEKAVASRMKDPDSAKFSNVFLVEAKTSIPETRHVAVCGTVDGKNSYGAYTGGGRFVVLKSFGTGKYSSEDTVFVQLENPAAPTGAFEAVYWKKYCTVS